MARYYIIAALLLGMAACLGLAAWLAIPQPPPPVQSKETVLEPQPGVPWFDDVTRAAGIDFVHFDPATEKHFIHETIGSGVGWIDFDRDGWPDLFCVQDAPLLSASGKLPTNRLYRNKGNGTFEDVTESVGLARSGYGQGVAVGDYDNDGYDDLLVSYLGGLVLYHNEKDDKGGRRFVDVTPRSGLKNPHWSSSVGWGDIDGDGLLDLYVCNYCEVDLKNYPECKEPRSGLMMCCPPSHFPAVSHKLFRNNGDGTFTDISKSSGIEAASPSPGLAVVLVDLDDDGKLDIYVANDTRPSYLFHNLGKGRFEEKALLSGCALGLDGSLIAGMGIAVGDIDGSGRPSLFVTNFDRKPNTLFLNRGNLQFSDNSMPSGLGGPSLSRLKFGTLFLDANLDSHLDVAVANGQIHRQAQRVFGTPYAQQAQLFTGDGKGRFTEVSSKAGPYFQEFRVGRGLADADFDRDGKPDMVFSHVGGPMALLRNRTKAENAWIAVELIGDGKKSNRNAIGAKLEFEFAGRKHFRYIMGGGSYLSAPEYRQVVGLGNASRVDLLRVTWPSGAKQEFRDISARQNYRLREGGSLEKDR